MATAPDSQSTKAGLVIGLFVAAIALMLVVVVLRTESEPDSFQDWIYPNCSPFAAVTNSEALSAVFMTRDSFTNVVDWYSKHVRMGKAGNPSFSARSQGLFSHGMGEQAGRIGSRNGTNAASEIFLVWRRGRALIVRASWNSGDGYTTIAIAERQNWPATNALFAPNILVNALASPGSIRGSGGQMRNLAAFAFTDTNSMAVLSKFWDPLVWVTNSSNARISGISTNDLYLAQVVPLPVGAAAHGREMDLLFMTPRTLSLIHVGESSSGTNQVVIGSITR
jgi:hypothetical protein